MLTEDQRMQMMYTGLANYFCHERALGWSRNQLLTIINISSLPLFVAATSIELRYLVSFIGVALNFFWYYVVNRRSRKRINYWQGCLEKTEPPEDYLLVFRVFTGSESKPISKHPSFYAVNLLPWMFFFIWLIATTNLRFPGTINWVFNLFRERGIL